MLLLQWKKHSMEAICFCVCGRYYVFLVSLRRLVNTAISLSIVALTRKRQKMEKHVYVLCPPIDHRHLTPWQGKKTRRVNSLYSQKRGTFWGGFHASSRSYLPHVSLPSLMLLFVTTNMFCGHGFLDLLGVVWKYEDEGRKDCLGYSCQLTNLEQINQHQLYKLS